MIAPTAATGSRADRTTPTRHPERARTDRAALHDVLDSGLIAHLGLVRDGAPVVLPVGYGRIGDVVYVHGSSGAGWVRDLVGRPACLTVTLLDAVVYARSVFHHSMNFRSAVVHGTARLVTDPDEHLAALGSCVEQLAPGSWQHARLPSRKELAATAVLALDLTETSVKVRTGPPSDDDVDVAAGLAWAGVLPVATTFGPPQPAPDLPDTVELPEHVATR